MGKKIDKARAYKDMMDKKWENKAITKADLEEMDREQEVFKRLAKEAREEWLAEIAAKGEKGE